MRNTLHPWNRNKLSGDGLLWACVFNLNIKGYVSENLPSVHLVLCARHVGTASLGTPVAGPASLYRDEGPMVLKDNEHLSPAGLCGDCFLTIIE